MLNLSQIVRSQAARRPDAEAVVYEGSRITYAELARRSARLAAGLVGQGIGPGDVVAVLMKNSAAFIEISLAVSEAGAVFLPLNFRLSAEEIAYITGNAEAKLILADAEFAAALPAGLPAVVVGPQHLADASDLLALPDPLPALPVERQAEDLMRLMYTSGTTDRPKGVMHSYANFYWKTADHIAALGLTESTRLLVVGPLYHVGAYDLPGVGVLWCGGTLVVLRDFDPEAWLAAVARERIDGTWLAPVMTTMILSHPRRHAHDVSSLRWVIGGGERTPESRIREFASVFPGARYIDAFGMTETCSGDTFQVAGREIEKIGSTGLPVPLLDLSIRDDEGRPLPAGTEGELCLRGPKVTKGYWKDPEKTAAAFFGDWFRTGDVGYVDAEGFLFLTDRKKDMIISGGENIASSEVERVILALPQVREAAVIGLPDEKWGERPVAFVVLAETDAETDAEAAILAHCRAGLAGFKVPRQIFFVGELPRNPSGKILKRVLRETHAGA